METVKASGLGKHYKLFIYETRQTIIDKISLIGTTSQSPGYWKIGIISIWSTILFCFWMLAIHTISL